MSRRERIDVAAAIERLPEHEPIEGLLFAELIAAYTAAHPGDVNTRARKWTHTFGASCAWDVSRDESALPGAHSSKPAVPFPAGFAQHLEGEQTAGS